MHFTPLIQECYGVLRSTPSENGGKKFNQLKRVLLESDVKGEMNTKQ